MAVKRITPIEAHELRQRDPSYVYLDVRSVPEWEQGHPAGSVNVPLLHLGPGGMSPNPDFLRVVEANFPKDAKLLVGCRTGGRSLQAAELLARHGYTNVLDVRGGYDGERDLSGRPVVPGWVDSQLPTGGGQPYTALKPAS